MAPNKSAMKEVLDWLVDYIKSNDVKRFDILPRELDICSELKVSRASVREAIAFLKAFGIVKSKTSVGLIMIADPRQLDLTTLFLHQNITEGDYKEIRQLRDFIELGSAHLMVQNATAKDIDILRKLIADMGKGEGESGKLSPMQFEIEFHSNLSRITGNKFAIALSLLYKPLFEHHFTFKVSDIPQKVIDEHRQIVDAIENKDIEALTRELRRQKHVDGWVLSATA